MAGRKPRARTRTNRHFDLLTRRAGTFSSSFCLPPPQSINPKSKFDNSGGGRGGIRTPGDVRRHGGLVNRSFKPLSHPSRLIFQHFSKLAIDICQICTMRAKNKVKSRYKITPFTNPSGRTAYRVSGTRPNGERIRENHGTEQEAATAKSNLELADQNLQPTPLRATTLEPAQLADAESAVQDLKPGVTLRHCVAYYNSTWQA